MAKNSLEKTTIFIVEDDEAWAASLKGKLKAKYDTHLYTTGEEAQQDLKKFKPKYIVLDYHLEGQMTGLDLLKVIQNTLPNTKVVMFTAQDDVQTALDILNSGAYDYVKKGESALNRLKIILRNLEEREELERQVYNMNIRVKRERLWLGILVVGILIGSLIIYLNTCPAGRPLKWDPFNVEQDGKCLVQEEETINLPGS